MKPRHARALLWTVITTGWLFILFGLAWINSAKAAEQRCIPYNAAVQALHDSHGEEVAFTGYVSDKAVLVVFVSRDRTWTLVAVSPDGKACLVAAGTDWQSWEPAY